MKAIYRMIRVSNPNNPTRSMDAIRIARDMHKFNVEQDYYALLKECRMLTKNQ